MDRKMQEATERGSKYLYRREDGSIGDENIETIFDRLYKLNYRIENEILVGNFNMYSEILLSVPEELQIESFDDVDKLEAIIEEIIGDKQALDRVAVSSPFRIELSSWGGKIFVQSTKYNIALALAIVQHMRKTIAEHFHTSTKH